MRAIAAAAVLLALASACDPGDDPEPQASCRGTYSGGVSGSFTCEATAIVDGAGVASVWIDVDYASIEGTAIDMFFDPIEWAGALEPGSYTQATSGIDTWFYVEGGSDAALVSYQLVVGPGGMPDQGTFTLTLDAADPLAATADGTPYEVHGSLTATLPPYPADPAAGTVDVQITF